MNRVLVICLFLATVAFGAESNLTITVDGVTYQNVRFQRTTPVSVTIFHSTGVATIPLAKLPPEFQKQLGYDPQRAAQWQAAQQEGAAEAAEARRKIAASVGWKLTVEKVLAGGVVARGWRIAEDSPRAVLVFLVEHPRLGELAEGDEMVATAYRDGVAHIGARTLERWVYVQSISQQVSQQPTVLQPPAISEPTRDRPRKVSGVADEYVPGLHATGAFGFPQTSAKVLCTRPNLRFSVWNNNRYLFAQAVLWIDNDSSLVTNADGSVSCDYSYLMLDLDHDARETPDVDRVYSLNQRPDAPGMHCGLWKKDGSISLMRGYARGRGAIRYVVTSTGKRVRVDTYLIPLDELSERTSVDIGICYYAYSPKPPLSMNSVTDDSKEPRRKYREYTWTFGVALDVAKVPDGRKDSVERQR